MTLNEALYMRKSTYKDRSCDELKADARRDILEYLNCYTDQLRFDGDTVFLVKSLAKAASCLEGGRALPERGDAHASEDMPEWAGRHPTIWAGFWALKDAFCKFMEHKTMNGEAVQELTDLFAAHKALASAVMSMPGVTAAERQAIVGATKK